MDVEKFINENNSKVVGFLSRYFHNWREEYQRVEIVGINYFPDKTMAEIWLDIITDNGSQAGRYIFSGESATKILNEL